ncbi:MAG: cytochrome c3 family protein [Armatimonadota bacterium]
MPLQIRMLKKALLGNRRLAWWTILPLVIAAVPMIVIADGGFYTQSKHGNPTTGIQRDTALPRGNCAQCHTSHAQNSQDFGLWMASDNTLCFTCHSSTLGSYFGQTTFSASGHAASIAGFNNRPVGRCVQCHNPHGAGNTGGAFANLTARQEEQVCFTCHGTGFRPQGAADIQTQVSKRYSHLVANFQRLHDDAAEIGSVGISPNPTLSGSSRHVECSDCHNTHYARTAPRSARSSNIGEMLLGSWGVRPIFSGAAWMQPTSYVVERFQSTTTEYESYLCFKCHSNWAWGNTAPYTADGMLQTNSAMEFSPNNPAYHNVIGQPAASVPTDDVVYGSANPPAYINQWGPNSAMACSDCHASDPSSGTVRGSHGSNFSFMLKKRFKAQAGATDNTGRSGTSADLCFDCHDWNTYGQGGNGSATNFRKESDNLHRMSDHAEAGCFQCHSAVPHGFKRKHMIVYVTDGSPYYQSDPVNYSMKKGGILAYSPSNNGMYQENNCKAACHDGHQSANPTNPLP